MSIFEIIGSILISPLKILFEIIFSAVYQISGHPGLSIVALSVAINIIVLPLYQRADAIQIEARDTENRLKEGMDHIKRSFSGDEKMMLLQTYYRQNDYSPLSVLKGSLSLMLEIPFFMAAYQFLSGVPLFAGAAFGPITDLSVPDGLISVGGIVINVLPVVMTLVNIISCSLYLKEFPLKTKIQLYGMALFFLVFLYNSPAALVLYWTLNNLFSLIKNLFTRFNAYDLFLKVLVSAIGVVFLALGAVIAYTQMLTMKYVVLATALGLIAQIPWMLPVLKKIIPTSGKKLLTVKPDTKLFVVGTIFLAVLLGLLIPSTYIAASPQEYIDTAYFYNPAWYVLQSLCISAGVFVVWINVFYGLANTSFRAVFTQLIVIISGIMFVNYMFFGRELGVVSANLQYTDGFVFARNEQLVNCVVVVVLGIALFVLTWKFPKGAFWGLVVGSIALVSMSALHINTILKAANETKIQISDAQDQMPSFSMSTEGNNVVVIMLDRGIGPFVPYIMEENPELQKQFEGFTYYSNTLSYGGHTNFAVPAIYGGYEYTPANLNLRSDELIADKHDEALKVAPTLFSNAGYDVTLIDPSYAGYKWTSDLSIFKDIPGTQAFFADGRFNEEKSNLDAITARKRNFFLFSLMKTLPVPLQSFLYNDGKYRSVTVDVSLNLSEFKDAYNVLKNMPQITNVENGDQDTYMFLSSDAAHISVVLQEPDFEPVSFVDNSSYYPSEGKTITANGNSILLDSNYKISFYHVNMAALMQLGNWFDYLRENDVYDNTRIIIVSDHGYTMGVFDNDPQEKHRIEFYMPMLLVKDFNATGYTVSDEFMTIADVPYLSMNGLLDKPVNPFTGKVINDDQKTQNEKHYVTLSSDWDIYDNNGYQFSAGEWASVSGDVTNKDNWVFYPEISVLPADLQK